MKYSQEALNLAKSQNDTRQIVLASCSVATAMVLAGKPSEALELVESVTELAQTPQQSLTVCTNKALATEALGRHDEVHKLWSRAEKLAEEIGRPYNLQLVSLELDRLTNNLESARTRMQWFEERGLMNGVNIAKRYFPELADIKEPIKQIENAVRLEVLGSLQTQGDKQTPVRGRKRQELLALLLEARISGRSEVSRLNFA